MTDHEMLLERVRLEAQLADYWNDIDRNGGHNATAYYTEDALFDGDRAAYRGHAEIEDFYRHRRERGARTSVHVAANFRVEFTGSDEAAATWYMLGFAADGEPPLSSRPPNVIALVSDRHVRQPDRGWLCSHRNFRMLFASTS